MWTSCGRQRQLKLPLSRPESRGETLPQIARDNSVRQVRSQILGHRTWLVILAQPPGSRAGNFLIHRSILLSFFPLPWPSLLCVWMTQGEELLHPKEIQQRFKRVFGRDMNRTEREVFFLPVEPSPEQEDEG